MNAPDRKRVREALKKARDLMDQADLSHPEIFFMAEGAFLEADVERLFDDDPARSEEDTESAGQLIEQATQILNVECENTGLSAWELYQRREQQMPRVRKALEIGWAAGFIEDPEVLAAEDRELLDDETEDETP